MVAEQLEAWPDRQPDELEQASRQITRGSAGTTLSTMTRCAPTHGRVLANGCRCRASSRIAALVHSGHWALVNVARSADDIHRGGDVHRPVTMLTLADHTAGASPRSSWAPEKVRIKLTP